MNFCNFIQHLFQADGINLNEPILFSIYGKDNIKKQRPYESYFSDNYWVISGTQPKGYLGGTVLIIIDATNSKIIRLTHGKQQRLNNCKSPNPT